ncbi:hydroxyectoine utilization dehydratase EutB [Sediminibacillus massiliensis]|uniref:hydroxyectoine utilization dehydratase EutB n=1 Tax=Sediminibacillus massiliensis TaxID=1926277 RepID=UPI0009883BC1|nr:hydroxyectoine utilization dehydratase EutB [Sediminibacillus massiliensis]
MNQRENKVTLQEVQQARLEIETLVQRTPLVRAEALSEVTKIHTYLKLETINQVGSFKIRGAANKIRKLAAQKKAKGVTTFSTGNHGLAVSYVAKQLGMRSVICVSNRVPSNKLSALKRYGAEIVVSGESQDEAAERCLKLQEQEGLELIPPFDDKHIIAGQGTIALELLEDLPELNEVIIPLSGGGLLSGIGYTVKQLKPSVKITGVSVEGASAMSESLSAGKPVEVPEKETLADSLLGGIGLDNCHTLSMVASYMDDLILLSEKAIAKGMAFLMEKERIIAEGAGAAGVAALLERDFQPKAGHIAVIVSGNNLDWVQFFKALREEDRHDCIYRNRDS